MTRPHGAPPRSVPPGTRTAEPYTALAPLYDQIMAHVDYEHWVTYLLSLCSQFAPPPARVLELGCGTGNLTFGLNRGLQAEFLATDASPDMLAVARKKMKQGQSQIDFQRLDFRHIDIEGPFDIVLLAYDGINYLLEPDQITTLLRSVAKLLRPSGLFLFDQSTPSNSINNLAYFNDEWDTPGAAYSRASEYDAVQQLHVTRFDVRIGDQQGTEIHYQRAYGLQEMELILKLSSLRVECCFDAFSVVPATADSERVQWVLSKPHATS